MITTFIKRVSLFILFFLPGINASCSGTDSLIFIESVKQFAYRVAGIDSLPGFYTKWSSEEKPYLYVYFSETSRVALPDSFDAFYFFGTDERNAAAKIEEVKSNGYHAFCYKTYANSSAMLNKRFVSYPKDAIIFIMLHEFTHNYIKLKNLKVPYEFNESLADVVGNYGALEFAMNRGEVNMDSVMLQIKTNEEIYSLLNKTIEKINRKQKKVSVINSECTETISGILKKGNLFQRDRFDYYVNNAFLLKNEYYCKYYFLLKKVYKKQKSLKAFMQIIESMPQNINDCEKYLKKYS